MGRHANTQPIGQISKPKRRERRMRAHQRFVAEMKATEAAIEARRCPNDGTELIGRGRHCLGLRCQKCGFSLKVLSPAPYSPRVPFNRQWHPKF